jgi:hypothetical protein
MKSKKQLRQELQSLRKTFRQKQYRTKKGKIKPSAYHAYVGKMHNIKSELEKIEDEYDRSDHFARREFTKKISKISQMDDRLL